MTTTSRLPLAPQGAMPAGRGCVAAPFPVAIGAPLRRQEG